MGVTMDNKAIGGRLKAVRVFLGFTQEQVANYLGTKREMISYIETGTRPINTITLQKLADLYGYRLSYFIDEKIRDRAPAVSMAFRVHDLSDKDLTTIAQVKKIAMNLDQVYSLLEG
jgi:transcriptional regulator with XRE-family HTH domain